MKTSTAHFSFSRMLITTFCALLTTGCAVGTAPLSVESPYRDPDTLARGDILHLATGRLLSESELIDYLSRYPVVYFGETHDSVEDHNAQLAILKGLEARFPGGVALGLEMLRRPGQQSLDAYLRGDMTEREFEKVWARSWGVRTFRYYSEILRFARAGKIPVLALNAGRDLRDAVYKQGFDDLEPEFAQRLSQMDLDDPYQRAMLEGILGGHSAGSGRIEVFHRIQVLWDETMARTAADYLTSAEGRDKRLVILAGGNHVRYGFGIPRRLFRRVPLAYSIVSGYAVEIAEDKRDSLMDVELPELPMSPADVYWATRYYDLGGERVALGVMIEPLEEGGVRVVEIVPDGPAAAAGLEAGDVIVSIGGTGVRETFDLTHEVSAYKPGDSGRVEVLRADRRLEFEVTYEVPE